MGGAEKALVSETVGEPTLCRALGLWSAVLYGLGVTVGAGIYVLIGPAAGRAGLYAPFAFVLAAVAMGFTGAAFAEFGSRYPVAAGEAAYVSAGLRSRLLSAIVGYLVIATGIVSAAAVSVGSAGYIALFVPFAGPILIVSVVVAMGAVACWGIRESVALAGLMTLIEVGGLLILVGGGLISEPELFRRLPEAVPAHADWAIWSGILSASLLAVFAFTGFENLANVAEEVNEPERVLPLAIFLTLGISTVLYVAVVWVSLVAVPAADLAASKAPLALVFQKQTGLSHTMISLIAIVATLNGVIVQFIMASRVLYGLAGQRSAPAIFRSVNKATRTPLIATLVVVAISGVLATTLNLERLADLTSRITLATFALVNLALIFVKWRETAPPPTGVFVVPIWVPVVGFVMTLAFLFVDARG
ncbi:MAG: amino acid permease [Hyphomicrobiaceae bacterium]|nr:amino acid permease [Hyphomicrobiaceae bacterium]